MKFESVLTISLHVLVLAVSPVASADSGACDRPDALGIDSEEAATGTMIAGSNRLDELTVVVDRAGNDIAASVLRMALVDADRVSKVLDQWGTERQDVEVSYRKGTVASEVVVRFPGDEPETWVFEIDPDGCAAQLPARTEVADGRRVALRAVAWNRVMEKQQSLESMLDLSLDFELMATTTDDALTCFAGGTGASACSADFGGIGDFRFGRCSANCSNAPEHNACCGSRLAGNCACIAVDIAGRSRGAGSSDGNDVDRAEN